MVGERKRETRGRRTNRAIQSCRDAAVPRRREDQRRRCADDDSSSRKKKGGGGIRKSRRCFAPVNVRKRKENF